MNWFKTLKLSPNRRNLFLQTQQRSSVCYVIKRYEEILKPMAVKLKEQTENYPVTHIYKIKVLWVCVSSIWVNNRQSEYVGDIGGDPDATIFAQFQEGW